MPSFFKLLSNDKKFTCLLTIIILTFFNNSILRVLKDTLIVSGNSSIEVVHFIKSFLVMPISILFVYFYTKLTLSIKQSRVIYYILSFFALFFALYSLVIYPFRDMIHPSQAMINNLKIAYPSMKWGLTLYGSWSYSLFYIIAELWSSVTLNLIFWQFANSINNIKEAKKNYVYFGVLGNIGMISGGGLISYSFHSNANFGIKISAISMIISIITLCILCIYRAIFNSVALNSDVLLQKSEKNKFKFQDLLGVFVNSKYLRNMMMLVFCYHMSSNLIEVTWKAAFRASVTNESLYARYMGIIYMISGSLSILLFYMPQQLMKRASWKTIAMIVPITLTVLASVFYIISLYAKYTRSYDLFSLQVLSLAGAVYYICNRFLKYGIFDPVKEIAYIPLKHDLKVKGKAMIDVFGSKFSKATSGYIQALLLTIMPSSTQISISYYLGYIVIFCMLIWIISINSLSVEYEKIANKE